MPRSKGRVGRPWRRVQAQVYAQERFCWLCGEYVDPVLPPGHPYSRSVDHLVQLRHGGDPHDRTNLRLAHVTHNSSRSARIQKVRPEQCACSVGLPCAVLVPEQRRGLLTVDLGQV